MLQFDETTTKLLEIAYQGGDVTRRRRMAFDALHLSDGDTVVDIGCGNGLLTEEIARAIGQSGHVIGVDPSADMRAPLPPAALHSHRQSSKTATPMRSHSQTTQQIKPSPSKFSNTFLTSPPPFAKRTAFCDLVADL